ncbi:MAG: DNA-binding protein, partial [Spongiibacter sp.]
MARPAAHAITDVERIAKQLKSQNKQVTPYRVQKLLGGGSFAWVKSALDQLGYQEDAGLPAGIDENTAQLLRLIQPLVDQLTQQARSDMDIAVQRLEKVVQEQDSTLSER